MRISLRWLRDYAQLDAPTDTLARLLVDTGTEVDEVVRDAEGTIVARIVSLMPVPEARKPIVAAVLDIGAHRTAQVLTGATNLRPGDLVAYAPPGVQLPTWDRPLEVRSMFGGRYSSAGMLLSAHELAVGEEADTVLSLDRGAPGQPVHEVLPVGVVFVVDVTSNRPDCLCHLGIARELAAALQEPLREPSYAIDPVRVSATSIERRAAVRVEDTEGCRRFCAAVIENVAVGPSPAWMRERLLAAGLRPINNVVDVTNFIAAELGQPLHAFDLDRLRDRSEPRPAPGNPAEVVVRRARAGEKVLGLDDREHELGPDDLAVCAAGHPASIAGVIGGATTAVDAATRTVLLEAASWDPRRIRATSRRLGVRTDASALFDKGLSDSLPPLALGRAASLVAVLGGGHVLGGIIDEHPNPLPPIAPIRVRGGFLEAVLGCHVDPSEAATALVRLGFSVVQEPDALVVSPPEFRRDVVIPVDVAEEVGRTLGYARVPATLPGRRAEAVAVAPPPDIEEPVREACLGAGFDEAITYAFTSAAVLSAVEGVAGELAPIALANPLSDEWSVMRTSLLPTLCGALRTNQHRGVAGPALFEIGRAYWEGRRTAPPAGSLGDDVDAALPPLPAEPLLLALVSQADDGDADAAAAGLAHIRSVLGWLVDELGGAALTTRPGTPVGWRSGRAARLEAEGAVVGVVGELSAAAVEALDLRGRVVAAELRLDAVLPEMPRIPRFLPPPRLPAVTQDLAVVVPADARADTALGLVRDAGGELLESAEIIDEYRTAALGEGRKSWTLRLVYRAAERTLTGGEAQEVHARIAAALEGSLGATVRS